MTGGWVTLIVAVSGVVFGGAGVAPVIIALARRGPIRADGEVRLSEDARRWADEFQEETRAARVEATLTRNEMRTIRREAEELSRYLLRVLAWIDTPGMDIDRLRRYVAAVPAPVQLPPNGREP
jgi:hypothetical protein